MCPISSLLSRPRLAFVTFLRYSFFLAFHLEIDQREDFTKFIMDLDGEGLGADTELKGNGESGIGWDG